MTKRLDLSLLSLDDLAGASNKLSLKRAQRDLEQGMEGESKEEGEALVVSWPDATCTFPPGGLHTATCTCPARKFCLHRVRSILWLQQCWQEETSSEAAPAPEEDPFADWTPAMYSDEELKKAGGIGLWRKATRALAEGVEVLSSSNTSVKIPALGITVRYIPGQSPEAALCSCGQAQICLHRILGALATREEPPEEAEQLDPQDPTLRERLSQRVAEMLATGLDGIPLEMAESLEALSLQTQTILPHPAKDLSYLARLIRDYHARSARFTPRQWLLATGRLGASLWSLASAQRQIPSSRLRGKARRSHLEAKTLDLAGLGAEGFQSKTGSVVKLWFLHEQTEELVFATVGRSGEGTPPPPESLWRVPLWGDYSPSDVAHRSLRLLKARLSPDGSLGKSDCQLRGDALQPDDLPSHLCAASSEELRQRWQRQAPRIFRSPQETTLPVVLALAQEPFPLPPFFEETSQTLRLPLFLAQGDEVTLSVKYGPASKVLIDVLERTPYWIAPPRHLFARFWPSAEGFQAFPLSVWLEEHRGPLSLGLGQTPLEAQHKAAWRQESPPEPPPAQDRPLQSLRDLLDLLEGLAMEGLFAASRWRHQELDGAARRLRQLNLAAGAAAMDSLARELQGAAAMVRSDPLRLVDPFLRLLAWTLSLEEDWLIASSLP